MGPRMRLFLVSALCGAGAFGLGLIAGKDGWFGTAVLTLVTGTTLQPVDGCGSTKVLHGARNA